MKHILLFLIFISHMQNYAQELTQTIRGTVVDKQTQSLLPGAIICILNSDPLLVTSTNELGKFRIDNVPLGRKQIKIYKINPNENINETDLKKIVQLLKKLY